MDTNKLQLLKHLESNRDLNVAFRSWELHKYPQLQQSKNHTWAVKSSSLLEKPRVMIIGFQTDMKTSIAKNMSHFHHLNISNLKVYLISEVFPSDNLNLDFNKHNFAILYDMYAQFQQSYYYKRHTDPCFNPLTFKSNAPLIVVDCSRQGEELLKLGSVDIRIEFGTNKAVPTKTTAYCLILHEKIIKYNPITSTVKVI